MTIEQAIQVARTIAQNSNNAAFVFRSGDQWYVMSHDTFYNYFGTFEKCITTKMFIVTVKGDYIQVK